MLGSKPKQTLFLADQHGFSLVEMAIALVVMVLLISGILTPLATQIEQRRIADTKATMDQIQEALIGYAEKWGYLPCPDVTTQVAGKGTPNDGIEDRNGSGCVSQEGNIPWQDLGVGAVDAWGNRFHYRVTQQFADSSSPFSLSSTGNITICEDTACTTKIATAIPAIIISYGKNGYGAVNANTTSGTTATVTAPSSPDELENTNGDTTFISRTQTPPVNPSNCGGTGQPACEFDDVVDWISSYTLFSQMISAGKLP